MTPTVLMIAAFVAIATAYFVSEAAFRPSLTTRGRLLVPLMIAGAALCMWLAGHLIVGALR